MSRSKFFGDFHPRRIPGAPLTIPQVQAVYNDVEAAFEAAEVELGSTFIPSPAPGLDAGFTAAQIVDPIMEVTPTQNRRFDPRDAKTSMAGTIWKSNTTSSKITVDVTTGGTTGWTTDAGLNTDFDLPSSDLAQSSQWVYRIDLPNKRINILPNG